MFRLVIAAVYGTVSIFCAPAWAVAPMLAAELARECTAAYGPGDIPERCAIYIAGFLDGAVATDARVAENVAQEFERKSTLTERAIRTRVGDRMQRFGPSVYAEYCIGDPVPVQEVIAKVQQQFQASPPAGDDLARDTVYTVLRSNYPCRE
jgi:hypothetical protein